jgi:hypothetical protein
MPFGDGGRSSRQLPFHLFSASTVRLWTCLTRDRHKALSYWFAGASWGSIDDDSDFGTAAAVADRTAARGFLQLRLVCRAFDVEASSLLFRKTTVCWSVWSSADVLLLRDLAKGQVAHVKAMEAKHGVGARESAEPSDRITESKPQLSSELDSSFKCQSILDFIGRFRRTRVFVQDGCLEELLEGLDNILALSSRPQMGLQLPSIDLVICNFKLVFGMGTSTMRQSRQSHLAHSASAGPRVVWNNGLHAFSLLDHGDLSWQAYLPDDDFASKVWQTKWGKPSDEQGREDEKAGQLLLDGFIGDEDCEYWGDQEKNHWLGVFEFCKRKFTANASFGGEKLDMRGHLVHYIYRRSADVKEKEEDTDRAEVVDFWP